MITLTQPSAPGESVSAAWARLRVGMRRLTAELRRQCPGVGGLTNLEATPRPERTWHAHAHVLLRLPDPLPPSWTHGEAQPGGWMPLDPWRIRLAWALAHLDRRRVASRIAAHALDDVRQIGRRAWTHKLSRDKADQDRGRVRESAALLLWSALCAQLGLPAVLDVRGTDPGEGTKYATKGLSVADGLSDWHLRDLLASTRGTHRTDAWGSLREVAGVEEDDGDEVRDPEVAECPGCGAKCGRIERDALPLSTLVSPDWWLRAQRLDRESAGRRAPRSASAVAVPGSPGP